MPCGSVGTVIQDRPGTTSCRASAGCPVTCWNSDTATANEPKTASVASPPETAFGSLKPKKAFTRKPTSGNRGISQA